MSGPDPGAADPGTAPGYCPECGAGLDGDANVCPACGARRVAPADRTAAGEGDRRPGDRSAGPAGDRSADRPADRSAGPAAESEAAFRERVRDYLVEGWEVEADHGDRVRLVDRSYGSFGGHLLVALATVWFTGGLGNLGYLLYAYHVAADRVVLRRGGRNPPAEARSARRTAAGAGAGREGGYPTGGLVAGLALFALTALTVELGGLATAPLIVAAFFALSGLVVFPPTRRRIRERHPVRTVGRVRSTEERAVRRPGTPCVACGAPVGDGVERRYSERVVLAGIPVYETEAGHNDYCRACASGEARAGAGVGVADGDGDRVGESVPADPAEEDGTRTPGAERVDRTRE